MQLRSMMARTLSMPVQCLPGASEQPASRCSHPSDSSSSPVSPYSDSSTPSNNISGTVSSCPLPIASAAATTVSTLKDTRHSHVSNHHTIPDTPSDVFLPTGPNPPQ